MSSIHSTRLSIPMVTLTAVALAANINSVSIFAQAAPAPPPLSSNIHTFATGLNGPRGLKFGPDGLLCVLEFSHAAGFPTPGFGDVVRIQRNGDINTIAIGLTVPTAMTFGPEGKLYVSNLGAVTPGTGQIVRVDLP